MVGRAGGGDRGGRHFGYTQFLGDASTHGAATVVGEALLLVVGLACWRGLGAGDPRSLAPGSLPEPFRHRLPRRARDDRGAAHRGVRGIHRPGGPDFEAAIILLSFVVATMMLYGHLTIATSLPRLRVAAISTAVIFGLMGVIASSAARRRTRGRMPQFSAELKPLNARLIPVQDTTAFFGGIQELKTSVDSLAREPE